MSRLVDCMAAAKADAPLIWLDYLAYAQKVLLAGAEIPWADVSAFVAFHRQAQRLLNSDVIAIPLAEFLDSYLQRNPQLREAMREKRRVVYALKVLLGSGEARSILTELVQSLRDCYARLPLVLEVPQPQSWTQLAYQQAHGRAAEEMTPDDGETAAAHVADFLRIFAQLNIDGLLFRTATAEVLAPEDLEILQPILNLAAHYRWDKGALLADESFCPGAEKVLHFAITRNSATAFAGRGTMLPESIWIELQPQENPRCPFYFAQIPANATPSLVLERVRKIRKGEDPL